MKKTIILMLCVLLFLFTACSNTKDNTDTTEPISTTQSTADENKEQFYGAWISYFELKTLGRSESEYREYLKGLFGNMKEMSVTDAFLHVRAFADAVYPSEIFPSADYISGEKGAELPFDVLSMALETGKEFGINIHAWINPYRATSDNNIESLPDCKIKTWISEGSDNVALVGNRYYFNPASDEVRTLIIDGVREILEKYPEVKGIHIDDYFYPENCGDFDEKSYKEYLSLGGSLSLSDFRRENVNSLISGIYSSVKSFGSDKIFSVSPSGDIDKNYSSLYADVGEWCSVSGYCDMIIPQVYFGFDNESLPFKETVDRWAELTENSDVKLVIGLALYKCGEEDKFAGEKGKNEWLDNSDIMKRQAEYIKEKNLDGFSLYSSSFINFSESFLSKELNNLKNVL